MYYIFDRTFMLIKKKVCHASQINAQVSIDKCVCRNRTFRNNTTHLHFKVFCLENFLRNFKENEYPTI